MARFWCHILAGWLMAVLVTTYAAATDSQSPQPPTLASYSVTAIETSPNPPRPLAMKNDDIGGWSWRYENHQWVWSDRRGLKTVGLYVRVWGRVTEVDASAGWFYIDDGSHLTNYNKTHVGVRVELTQGAVTVTQGSYIAISGISSAHPDDTTGDHLAEVVTTSSRADIQQYP